jgi:hypothetical protein
MAENVQGINPFDISRVNEATCVEYQFGFFVIKHYQQD